MNISHILKRPIITEKSLIDASNNVFTFEVNRQASKNQIREAIEKIYGVNVIDIRTVTTAAKSYRVGKRRLEKTGSSSKKARVKLKAGEKIDLFELDEA